MANEPVKRALIVEDAITDRTLLRQILTGLGYLVSEAADGEEGVQMVAKQGPFILSLVDWNMPKMNGLDFVRAVRANAKNKEMRIVMVTSEIEMDKIRTALMIGANEYIMKPFSREMVNIKLKMLGLGG